MARFDILVHMRRCEADSLAANVALALATKLDAHVSGLYVASLGTVAYSTLETVVFQVQEADELYRAALAQRDPWMRRLADRGISGEWLVAQGEPVEAICHAARWCDLVVAERPQLVADAPIGWGIVSRTVFGAGVPVVVVPESAKPTQVGERILVAWNHSLESARAIHGALPLLRQAGEVLVLDGGASVNPVGARHLPALDIAAYFARHGVRAQFRPFAATGNYGAGILDAAHAAGSDLIVMGAWGSSRIAELVLGGATRHLFQYSNVPLFVAH